MTTLRGFYKIFHGQDLIPAVWRIERPAEEYFITNPAIALTRFGWVMAYKVVTANYKIERFAICRLDQNFNVIPGSQGALSDTISNVNQQVGDPRLLLFRQRLFVLFCHFRLPSLLYLAELDLDSLEAVGEARPLFLDNRQWQEKNWMLFEYQGELWAVYTISPHVILKLKMTKAGAIDCERQFIEPWDITAYREKYGEPRGGSLPVQVHDRYYVFFHSWRYATRLHQVISPYWARLRQSLGKPYHWQGPRVDHGDVRLLQNTTDHYYQPKRLPCRLGSLMNRYEQTFARRICYAGVYTFQGKPPFHPLTIRSRPLISPDNEASAMRTNPLTKDHVVFPGGAVCTPDQGWLVSYGVHDERCVLRGFDQDELTSSLETELSTR